MRKLSNKEIKELEEFGWQIISINPFKIVRDAQFAGGIHTIETEKKAIDELVNSRNLKWINENLQKFIQDHYKRKTRDPERIDKILTKLSIAWKKHPDWRLGQLLTNFMQSPNMDLFYLEDNELEKLMNNHINLSK